MRLTETEIGSIRFLSKEIFGQETIVRLFGSRTNDFIKGGDIDLFLQTSQVFPPRILLLKKAEFLARLEHFIGEQKVDLLIHTSQNCDLPIVRSALKDGIVL